MRNFFCLFLVLVTLSLMASHYKYDLSICMIFKDEAPYLKEWIEFHRLLGVDHFYLYDNNSKDNCHEVLRPYLQNGVVELIEWPQVATNIAEWDQIQVAAYNDGFNRAKTKTKWLAIIDSDEFLFPTVENNLKKFLKKYEKQKAIGGILVSWVCFGTSWVEKIPDNKLLIETLTLSAASGSDHFKCVFMPKKVSHVCSPHYVIYKDGYRHCTPSGEMPPFIEIDKIRINHYWSRDEWYLNNFKTPRRVLWGTDPATSQLWGHASNRDYDSTILRFVESLRKRMENGKKL
ncbi:MAG: glycosyltransferase family 92 protein [Parachlamydiaceae bacterium]|nr:glycosyltransferase family 92 protein [Parachlamydiaceae bacterium]